MVDSWNLLKLTEPFFLGTSLLPQFRQKRAQSGPKITLFGFFQKDLLLVFPRNNLKCKLTLLLMFPAIPYLAKFWFSSHGLKCCCPTKLPYSVKCNISNKKIFSMQINIEVFSKLILSLLGVHCQACPKCPK